MAVSVDSLRDKIRSRKARAGIVGLGYVGLPLAVELGKAGFHTTGIDLDARKVQLINDGQSYIPDVQRADVQALRSKGLLDATTDFGVVARARHHQHLRADAAAQDEGPRHVLHRVGGRRRSRRTSIRAC